MAIKLKTPAAPPPPTGLPENAADILRVWRTLEAVIMDMPEPQAWALLQYEKDNKGRHLFLQRLYGRASTLRSQREARELRASIKDREA